MHVTDLSWKRINHPSDVVEIGSNVKVKVLKFDEEITRLSLGIKQLTDDPWEQVSKHFVVNNNYDVEVSSISDQAVTLSMSSDFDGYIQLSELSWLKKPPHPSKITNSGSKITVKLIEIDGLGIFSTDSTAFLIKLLKL